MLRMLFGLFKPRPERESRRLNKDAADILEMARVTYRDSVLSEIARLTRAGIKQMDELVGDDEVLRTRELDQYKTLHREARRQHSETRLTAYTLVIIYGQGLEFGELTRPTRDAIDEFLAEWPSQEPADGTLVG